MNKTNSTKNNNKNYMKSRVWHNICCDRISWILTNQKYARNSSGNIQHQMIIPKYFAMMLRDLCAAQYNQNDEYREFGHSETGFIVLELRITITALLKKKQLEKNTVEKSESQQNNGK